MKNKTWAVINSDNGAVFGFIDAKTRRGALTEAYNQYSKDRRFTLDIMEGTEYKKKLEADPDWRKQK